MRCLLAAAALALAGLAAAAEPVAFVHVNVLTMQPGQAPQLDRTVLVRDGRIEAIGVELPMPGDVRRIDATGRWLSRCV